MWALSIFAGLTYFVTIPWHPFPGSTVLKGLSVSTMAVVAWLAKPPGANRVLLTAALALSSLGDVLLEFGAGNFVYGLGSFLLAHVCYVALFLRQRSQWPAGARLLAAGAVLVFSVFFVWWLLPVLGPMRIPVMLYIGVITAMVLSSLRWQASTNWIILGAFLFLISDAVLGASRFREPLPLRGWIVWSTYYGAQYLITRGVLRENGA